MAKQASTIKINLKDRKDSKDRKEIEEVEEINMRLKSYLTNKSLTGIGSQPIHLDPVKILSTFADKLKGKELFICHRRRTCRCKSSNKCDCDSDYEISLSNVKLEIHSNCRCSLEFFTHPKINKKIFPESIRVFSLAPIDAKSDLEHPLLDICPENTKDNAREEISYGKVVLFDEKIFFELNELPHISDHSVLINFDYMSFSKI